MLLACVLFALMANCVYAASRLAVPVAARGVRLVRAGGHLGALLLPAPVGGGWHSGCAGCSAAYR